MKCTNCASEVADGIPECPMCNALLSAGAADAFPLPAPAPDAGGQTFEAVKTPQGGGPHPALYLVPVALLGALAYFFLIPVPGLPVPPGSTEDAEERFAASAPAPDWAKSVTKEKTGGLVEALAFREPGGAKASFVVFVSSVPLPDFSEAALPEIRSQALASVMTAQPEYQHQQFADAAADNLKAVRLTGSMSVRAATAPGAPPAPPSAYQVTALMVSGTDRSYLLVGTVPAQEVGSVQPLLEKSFDAFRVTDRPVAHPQEVKRWSRVAAVVGGALLVLLLALKVVRGIMS